MRRRQYGRDEPARPASYRRPVRIRGTGAVRSRPAVDSACQRPGRPPRPSRRRGPRPVPGPQPTALFTSAPIRRLVSSGQLRPSEGGRPHGALVEDRRAPRATAHVGRLPWTIPRVTAHKSIGPRRDAGGRSPVQAMVGQCDRNARPREPCSVTRPEWGRLAVRQCPHAGPACHSVPAGSGSGSGAAVAGRPLKGRVCARMCPAGSLNR